ncbi:peptidoglycan editing factor PgeF [Hyphomicrobium methylovorum]|uniref:peptidoglycan editing factor PgeF n=1 Tax=Hyphomicrobium methylovorum TaxID=84 RepID=UPI0015E6C898|nr:peptidoglycan editing factor PgeF [Hyphomicrobium methylovorum]MBA2126936.1 peptidoglycan editing factor PgeF [Hyphomicrobium methylovorum]
MLAPLLAPNLQSLSGIRHGFFTRQGGVSEGIYASLNCGAGSNDDRERVLENRRRIADHLGGSGGNVVTLYQEHGATARTVTDLPLTTAELPHADAVVSATPGLAIGILTADCAPVLFADAEARVVAAAHAGWRGALGGIVESAVREMERLGARREHIAAAVGPCISQRAYEVGPEFEAQFLTAAPGAASFFVRSDANARPHFDLQGFVMHRLAEARIANVARLDVCTCENESLFYSYRRKTHLLEPDYGRQISAIVVA